MTQDRVVSKINTLSGMFSLKSYQQYVNQREARIIDTISTTSDYELLDTDNMMQNSNGEVIAKRFLSTYFSNSS